METYEVTVYTGKCDYAATFNRVFIKLVGTDGESEHTELISPAYYTSPFSQGEVSSFKVSCPQSLGQLVSIKLNKQCGWLYTEDAWFLDKVEVKIHQWQTYKFPIYRWIKGSEVYCFREGTARVVEDKKCEDQLRQERQQELRQRNKDYSWDVYKDGLPHCIKAENPESLPDELEFSSSKDCEFKWTLYTGLLELKLYGLINHAEMWPDMNYIRQVFCSRTTELSAYMVKHWRADSLFGYQFLNGVNPMMIRRCTALPNNFPVTDDMVFLHGRTLAEEMENGNIFLCDYKNLDGLQANTVNGKKQYLMAPLVLLHKTPKDKLMPVAIQLKQTPAEDNPIFVPNDSEYDWLLAKTFVRSADFSEHQLSSHLLRTHLLAEVFAMSLLRKISLVHPLYKLLIPHTRYTLHINILARINLISEDGFFNKYAACGGEAMITILQRSLSSMTYRSLCIKDDIADRGLESVPNFYYRDDGFRVWDIIHRFVEGVLKYYYSRDAEVHQSPLLSITEDSELQNWIKDIFEHGFLCNASTGIPQKFSTMDELVKFVTMVIFTCSAQHSAVNTGQYDYGGWMPNAPVTLQRPPPISKGVADEETLLQTLPDVNASVNGLAAMWLLSKQSSDFIRLGQYPEEHFSEETPCKLITDFQGDLLKLSASIQARNKTLKIPYTYMDPAVVENSVAI